MEIFNVEENSFDNIISSTPEPEQELSHTESQFWLSGETSSETASTSFKKRKKETDEKFCDFLGSLHNIVETKVNNQPNNNELFIKLITNKMNELPVN